MRQALTLALVLLALTISGCSDRGNRVHEQQHLAFGTLVDITIYGTGSKRAEAATAAALRTLDRLHRTWHPWEASPLTEINDKLAQGQPATVETDLRPVIRQAKTLSKRTDGLFNPAIGQLIALWGFHSDDPPSGPPPQEEAIAELLAKQPSMADLTLSDGTLTTDNPAVQLDFGAFAKGYGVDRAIEVLRDHGIDNAIVNAGGDLRAIGRRGDRRWRIGIRDPRGDGVLAMVQPRDDESVFTSGDYERFYTHQDKRYHHILDPRTGYPAQDVTSVTVIYDEAAVADVVATALFVAGPEGWQALAKGLGIKQVMLVDARGRIHMSQAMSERVDFVNEPEHVMIEPL